MLTDYRLRPLTANDLPQLLAWRNAPATRSMMFSAGPIAAVEHRRWFEAVSADPARHVLLLERRGEALATVNFTCSRHADDVYEWGFYKAPEAPPGTGSALGLLGLDWLFAETGAHKVAGEVLSFNEASQRFHLKLAFVEEGRLRQHYRQGSQCADILCYGLLRAEWQASRATLIAHLAQGRS